MSQATQFELVSFDLCPYVQRSVITLKHKKVDFKITYIDLANPPEWFNQASPLGKVPILLVRNAPADKPRVLFESAVINEYMDEMTPPSLLPKDAFDKAEERAWVVVSGEILMMMGPLLRSHDQAEIDEAKKEIWETLAHVEKAITGKDTFSASGFSLADAAFAPAFMRMLMMKSLRDDPHWKSLPKTRRWADALLQLPEVRDSVIPEFKQKYVSYLRKNESLAVNDIS